MLSDYYIHCRQYVKCINGKSLTSQRVQLSPPTDRLPRLVWSPSSGRSAPLDKKLLSVLTSPMVIEKIKNLYKRLSENTRRRLWYLSERISARHFVPSTFLKIIIFQNPCLHFSARSPESCCPQEAGWVAEVLDIVCCLVWHFYQWWWLWEKSCWHIWHMTYMTNHIDTPWLGLRLCNISPRPQLLSLNHGRAPINVYINIILLHAECYQKVSWPMANLLFTLGRYYALILKHNTSDFPSRPTSWGGTSNETVLRSTFL